MNETISYCDNGCTRGAGDNKIRVQTTPPSRLCDHCEDRLHQRLTKIPELYALLPTFVEHGTIERNPDAKATPSATAQAPMRLDIIDLLDTRRGRHWQGLFPTTDRRGTVGWLKVHIDTVIEERAPSTTGITTMTSACAFLNRHRLWIFEQDWAVDLYEDIKRLHRQLSDAVGDYRRPPVGRCHVETGDEPCAGSLFANPYGGVHCSRCGATWDANHLRQLGLAQATQESA